MPAASFLIVYVAMPPGATVGVLVVLVMTLCVLPIAGINKEAINIDLIKSL